MILWRREKQAGLNKKNNSSAWGGPARKLGFLSTLMTLLLGLILILPGSEGDKQKSRKGIKRHQGSPVLGFV